MDAAQPIGLTKVQEILNPLPTWSIPNNTSNQKSPNLTATGLPETENEPHVLGVNLYFAAFVVILSGILFHHKVK